MLNARRSALLRSLKKPLLALALISVPLALGGLSGCGDGGTATDACFDYASFKADPAVTFKAGVLPIFQRSCTFSGSCHGVQNAPAPAQHYYGPAMGTTALDTDIVAIFAESVGKPAVDEPAMKVIEAGKPETSFMMYKLDGLDCEALKCSEMKTCLGSMPQNSPQLSVADRNIIRSWIKNGAMNN
jgi:hypothetical protein